MPKNIFWGKYSKGIPRLIDVNSRWIFCGYVEDQISTNFHVVSTYFFGRNFDGQKIRIVTKYFFPCNFDGRKIHLASTYFFRCNFFHRSIHCISIYIFRRNFDGRIIHFVCTYFFRRNFDEFNVTIGKLLANENIRGGFPLLVTLKSWLLQDSSL